MSAAAVLTPRVRVMVICDAVRESKIETDVFDLNAFGNRIPQGRCRLSRRSFGYFWFCRVRVPARSQAISGLSMTGPKKPCSMDIWILARRSTLTQERRRSVPRFGAPFPEDGTYSVQVWFFRAEGSDVLKGEMPFSIKTGGNQP